MRVLVADSDDASVVILRSYLHDRGYEVDSTNNGLQCFTMLHEFAPDILVLSQDLLWGGGDGVMAQMRDDPVLAGTPVVLITDDPFEKLDSPSNPPMVGWLRKPFRLSELLRQLGTVKQTAQMLLNTEK